MRHARIWAFKFVTTNMQTSSYTAAIFIQVVGGSLFSQFESIGLVKKNRHLVEREGPSIGSNTVGRKKVVEKWSCRNRDFGG